MKLRFWENRESGGQSPGNYSDAIVRLLESVAANKTIDASSTAAVEAAAGALSRAFMAAEVSGPTWALKALNPVFLGQIGRDLVRSGSSMHRIDIDGMGMLRLTPASQWYFTGPDHETDWSVQCTTYGPSGSTTRYIPYAGVVFIRWGSRPGTPYLGVGPDVMGQHDRKATGRIREIACRRIGWSTLRSYYQSHQTAAATLATT